MSDVNFREHFTAKYAAKRPKSDLLASIVARTPAEVRAAAEANHVLGDLVGDVAKRERTPIRSYPTFLPELDHLLGGGVSTRQLTSVLGPPGAGKTAFAVALALHMESTLPVLYVSTELEADELAARVAAAKLDSPWRDIVRGRIDRDRVREALAGLRIRVVGCDQIPREGTTDAIRRTVAAMVTEYGEPPLVIVDYLQDLVRGTDERNVRTKIGDVATVLRSLAQDLDCPLIAISSVSRAYYSAKRQAEMRALEDPTTYLAAAKESGDVDYASAAVLFLDVEPAGALSHRLAQIAVAKSRHGETGFAGARFYAASGRWQSDPGAVGALGDGERVAGRQSAQDDADESKAMATVQRLKSRPMDPHGRSGLESKSDLKKSIGGNAARAYAAITRLLDSRMLIERAEAYGESIASGEVRQKTRRVIDVAESLPLSALTLDRSHYVNATPHQ